MYGWVYSYVSAGDCVTVEARSIGLLVPGVTELQSAELLTSVLGVELSSLEDCYVFITVELCHL